jgi:hypothetical protein
MKNLSKFLATAKVRYNFHGIVVEGPRSNNPVRKLPVPGNSGDFVGAVFRPVPTEKHRNPPEKIRTISGRNAASMFQRVPVFSCRIRSPESST